MFEYACDPEMAQISNRVISRDHMFFPEMTHFFQLENPEIAQFELEILITCFFLGLSQDFQTEKVSYLRKKTRDHEKLNGSSFEPSQDHVHIQTCDIGSFDDFLSYLRVPPVLVSSSPV